MAYGKGSYRPKRSYKQKNKYTEAEKIAFRLGQEQRVRKSVNSQNTNTRVYDSFCKGLNGMPSNKNKPLFNE